MFVLCCITKARMMVNWQSVHCVSVGSWPVSLALKGPFGIKQRKLPVIVTASVIARLLPHIFKPSPLYPILFRALCLCGFPAGRVENRLLTVGIESFGSNECCMYAWVCICLCVFRRLRRIWHNAWSSDPGPVQLYAGQSELSLFFEIQLLSKHVTNQMQCDWLKNTWEKLCS